MNNTDNQLRLEAKAVNWALNNIKAIPPEKARVLYKLTKRWAKAQQDVHFQSEGATHVITWSDDHFDYEVAFSATHSGNILIEGEYDNRED